MNEPISMLGWSFVRSEEEDICLRIFTYSRILLSTDANPLLRSIEGNLRAAFKPSLALEIFQSAVMATDDFEFTLPLRL